MSEFECPGCNTPLTETSLGGYREYCDKCVEALPPWPKGMKSGHIEGFYPNFKWLGTYHSKPINAEELAL